MKEDKIKYHQLRYDYDGLLDRMHELEQFAMLKNYINPVKRAALEAKERERLRKLKKAEEANEEDQDAEKPKKEEIKSALKSKSPKREEIRSKLKSKSPKTKGKDLMKTVSLPDE